MSFGRETQLTRLKEAQVEGLYQKLSESMGQTPDAFHFDDFKLIDGRLYYRDKSMPSMTKWGKLRLTGVIAETLGKEGLIHGLGFDIPVEGKVMD